MPPPHTFLNFAYGSNMSTRRLQARTPSARPLGMAQLVGHQLRWHKIGQDGSAKCDIFMTEKPTDVVWGVLFEIALAEEVFLHHAEGLGDGYEHKRVTLQTERGEVKAGVYYATYIDATLRPFDWYVDFVRQGAEEHGLPQDYRNQLNLVEGIEDPDPERRKKHLVLLRSR